MKWVTGALRRWRTLAILGAVVIVAGVVIALLQPPPSGYLDPNDTSPAGGHALAVLLATRGQHVLRAPAPAAASGGAPEGSLELITRPELLTGAQLAQAAHFDGDILLIGPDARALGALAPAIRLVGSNPGTAATPPACSAQPAALAGDADLGGAMLQDAGAVAQSCYPAGDGGYYFVQYPQAARTITVLGSGAPFTNQYLGQDGDAALALNLLRQAGTVTWVVPSPSAAGGQSATGQKSFFSLVPLPAYLIAIQLAIAALLAAAWRARRLGPLVAERLPVIVRASETVEGHGRLYQARRARDRAAGELRAAASSRIATLTGGDVSPISVAARTGHAPAEVEKVLAGPPPASDEALVTLAADLDTLTRKIRQS